MALYGQGKKEEAIKIWQETGRNEKNPKVLSTIGYAYARSDFQLAQALRLCQNSFQESPKTPLIKRNLGWEYFKSGDVQRSRELLEAIDLGVPDFIDAIKADRQYEFYDAAILLHVSKLYFKMVSQVNAPGEQLLAATASYELGEYETAMERFQKLSNQNNPTDGIVATIRLGACYYKLNQPEKAHRIWNDLRQKNPNDKDMLSELGRVYSSLKINPQEAAEALCTQALPTETKGQVLQKNYTYYRTLGWVYLNHSKYEEAITMLSKTRNLRAFNNVQRNTPLFFLRLANCYYHLNNFTEALSIYGALAVADKACVQIHKMVSLITIMERKQDPGVGVR
jgi:tetratricopeptide (TPR) repeat protein